MKEKNTEYDQDLVARIDRALDYSRAEDYDKSREELVALLQDYPDQPVVLFLLTDVCDTLGDYNAAVEYGRRAVHIAPKYEKASVGLFFALRSAQRDRDAIDELVRFLSIGNPEFYKHILEEIIPPEGAVGRFALNRYLLDRLSEIRGYEYLKDRV